MDFVYVNRTELTTFRTIPSEYLLHLLVHYLCRDFSGKGENITVVQALVIAEALSARVHPTHNYR
jgi:hypothetical protein